MRDDLTTFDNFYGAVKQDLEAPDDVEALDAHICIGARQRPCTFDTLPEWCRGNSAFTNFRVRLATFLQETLPSTALPKGARQLRFKGDDKVSPIPYLSCILS